MEYLRREKTYKLGKAQNKVLDTMLKKHAKDRATMQKNHITAIEKLTKGKEWVHLWYTTKITY